mgnify:CR=1 FL=1
MAISRLSLSKDRRSGWQIDVDFGGVREAISHSDRLNSPVFLVGDDLVEETRSYYRATGYSPDYRGVHIDIYARHPFDILKPRFRGHTATLRKVIGFLSHNHLITEAPISVAALNNLNADAYEFIRDRIVSEYISSRKDTDSSYEDIEWVLASIDDIRFDGPVVFEVAHAGFSYLQWIVAIKWASQQRKSAFVILVNESNRSFTYENHAVREPITFEELVPFLASQSRKTESEVNRLFRVWKASRSYLQKTRFGKTISVSMASQFADFVLNVEGEESSAEDVQQSIPVRVRAPLMFAAGSQFIDIDHEAASGVSAAASRGAARALKHQAEELIRAGILTNVVPGMVAVLLRIAGVISRLDMSDVPEESDIIELGVEVSFFQGSIFEAASRISEVSQGEVLSFIGESNKFLNRFEAWRAYNAVDVANGQDSHEAGTIALELLRKASDAGLLSQYANQRVENSLSGGLIAENPALREGFTRSSENLASVVGRIALKELKSGTESVKKEVSSEVSKGLVQSARSFIVNNSQSILRLSNIRAEKWIEMVVNLIKES